MEEVAAIVDVAIMTVPLPFGPLTRKAGVELPVTPIKNALVACEIPPFSVDEAKPIERTADGVEVPMPMKPDIPPGVMEIAGGFIDRFVDVAKVVGEEVPI